MHNDTIYTQQQNYCCRIVKQKFAKLLMDTKSCIELLRDVRWLSGRVLDLKLRDCGLEPQGGTALYL